MPTKDDIERALTKACAEAELWETEKFVGTFFQSLAIDEDKAVEEMARGIYESAPHTTIFEAPYGGVDGRIYSWEEYKEQFLHGEFYKKAKAALHASPYYKLVKMMGEV